MGKAKSHKSLEKVCSLKNLKRVLISGIKQTQNSNFIHITKNLVFEVCYTTGLGHCATDVG